VNGRPHAAHVFSGRLDFSGFTPPGVRRAPFAISTSLPVGTRSVRNTLFTLINHFMNAARELRAHITKN
jgi:hypothetical protein